MADHSAKHIVCVCGGIREPGQTRGWEPPKKDNCNFEKCEKISQTPPKTLKFTHAKYLPPGVPEGGWVVAAQFDPI